MDTIKLHILITITLCVILLFISLSYPYRLCENFSFNTRFDELNILPTHYFNEITLDDMNKSLKNIITLPNKMLTNNDVSIDITPHKKLVENRVKDFLQHVLNSHNILHNITSIHLLSIKQHINDFYITLKAILHKEGKMYGFSTNVMVKTSKSFEIYELVKIEAFEIIFEDNINILPGLSSSHTNYRPYHSSPYKFENDENIELSDKMKSHILAQQKYGQQQE
jgi:hypothetical protein